MTKRAPHNVAIDALRGFSILIVMLLHGFAPIPKFLLDLPGVQPAILNGFYGVTIFFVISGFLISTNVLRRDAALSQIRIDQFYAMRVGRILPCVLLFVLLYTVLFRLKADGFVPAPPALFFEGVKSLFELQYGHFYLTGGNVPGMYAFSPLWSLSIDETFYLLFPIVCFLLKSDTLIVPFAAILVALGPVLRREFTDGLLFWGAADLLAMGCIAAKIASRISGNKGLQWLSFPLIGMGSAAMAVSFVFFPNRPDAQWSLSIVGLGAACFLIGASFVSAQRIAETRSAKVLLFPIAFLGRMSLQLYVFHMMANILVGGAVSHYALFPIFLAICWLLGRFFLDPVNNRIRAVYKRHADPVPQQAQAATSLS